MPAIESADAQSDVSRVLRIVKGKTPYFRCAHGLYARQGLAGMISDLRSSYVAAMRGSFSAKIAPSHGIEVPGTQTVRPSNLVIGIGSARVENGRSLRIFDENFAFFSTAD